MKEYIFAEKFVMNYQDLLTKFDGQVRDHPDVSEAITAIQMLIDFIKQDTVGTIAELRKHLNSAITCLTGSDQRKTACIRSGCELFLRFITLTTLDQPDFEATKCTLVDRGNLFVDNMGKCRSKISRVVQPFLKDGSSLLLHARSRVVLQIMQEAVALNKDFKVYVTESMPDRDGAIMKEELEEMGIDCTLILDACIGYIMEKVDLVLVGAYGVMESGGIVNKIGTYTMAITAKALNKPVYAVAESFKFTREYPVNQQDVPLEFKYTGSKLKSGNLQHEHPIVDYTPPSFINLLFTDLGVLTPSAVSDELMKLYL